MEETHINDKCTVSIVGPGSEEQATEVGGKDFCFYGDVAVNILHSPKSKIFSYIHVIYFETN